jgi:hypothetical protein
MTIKELLGCRNSFYFQDNYKNTTRNELNSIKPIEKPICTYNTEKKAWRIVKDILSVIIFPIGLYRLIHAIAGIFIVLNASLTGRSAAQAAILRKKIDLDTMKWKVKRISVAVDGYLIDAAILGRASTFTNGRWILASNGNSTFYEDCLRDPSFKHILSELDGNAIVFNYPGVGSSSGLPNRNAMAKAYRAMLHFLEDQENGIGAKEIIGYGHSLGGGVQGDALLSHELKRHVKYCFVKSRTFSELSKVVSDFTNNNRLLVSIVKPLGWNITSVDSSKRLKAPEIIMQTANVSGYTDISGQLSEIIVDDMVISAEASLAKSLLEDRGPFVGTKYFLGIKEKHNEGLNDPTHLVEKIHEMLGH